MNPNISALYAAIHDNKIVVIETNLQAFVGRLTELQLTARNYMWYNREFKKHGYFTQFLDGKEYYFQKLL